MPPSDRRLVIAFFTGEDRSVQDAASTMQRLYPSQRIDADPTGARPSDKRPTSYLRMPDEAMLSVWLPVSDLAVAVQTLQAAHARSIFLTGGGMPANPFVGGVESIHNARGLTIA